jgi:hypothetical protein
MFGNTNNQLGINYAQILAAGAQQAQSTNREFNIQQEDFPALSANAQGATIGSSRKSSTIRNIKCGDLSVCVGQTQLHQPALTQSSQMMQEQQAISPPLQSAKTPISRPSTTPPGAVSDRFGLMGLLGVIRMTDQDLNTLALGCDLTILGLNLNSTE